MPGLDWPALPNGRMPVWDGESFRINGEAVPYLSYSQNLAGWDDGLTSLHKRESAGQHPIDVTSRSHVLVALKTFHSGGCTSFLEIGSSDGLLLKELRATYRDTVVVGSEVAADALAQIANDQPGIPLLQLDILDCKLPDSSFDAVVALNVLEHIQDDERALQNMARLLVPGGTLVIEVPAGPHLYDAYDRQLRHYRRYRMCEILQKISAVGLRIVHKTHVGFFVYPAFAAIKKMNRMRREALEGKDVVSAAIRQSRRQPLLEKCFELERAMFPRISLPIGIRCVVIGQKT